MATKSIAWNTGSGNITLTYNGQGDGTITVQSDANDIGSARSKVVTIETTKGSSVITKNLTISQAACPFPVGDVRNYSYSGSYYEVELPAGQYKWQCWGAQGGSNAAASSYGITAKAGGKGGYSEGVIALSTKTTVRVYVGGQGSSSAGGFNGGGSTTGSASYNSGNEQGVSRMGGGGGATDIRLSDGALLSRMIVAGGGSGGAMCYKEVTTTTTTWETIGTYTVAYTWMNGSYRVNAFPDTVGILSVGNTYKLTTTVPGASYADYTAVDGTKPQIPFGSEFTVTKAMGSGKAVSVFSTSSEDLTSTLSISIKRTSSSTTTDSDSQVGYVGGGINGGGYNSNYQGKQNVAGSGGSFGQGANQTASNYRYCSGAGGGGWYGGGGGQTSNDDIASCKNSGGGSGFVNTAASSGNRPSGYTGLELDSGSTVDGEQTFKAPAGGTETGHTGNGYARITRLE